MWKPWFIGLFWSTYVCTEGHRLQMSSYFENTQSCLVEPGDSSIVSCPIVRVNRSAKYTTHSRCTLFILAQQQSALGLGVTFTNAVITHISFQQAHVNRLVRLLGMHAQRPQKIGGDIKVCSSDFSIRLLLLSDEAYHIMLFTWSLQ